jgi:GT2 family glycosyltransferase
MTYEPSAEPLITGPAAPNLCACIIIPARNEEEALPRTLDALRLQRDLDRRLLDPETYEVILLLNNCTDSSQFIAEHYQRTYPLFRFHIAACDLPPDQAHVGTARRLLMDTAYHRLQSSTARRTAILSTDADTVVASDWVVRNLAAIEAGADAVGGVINLFVEDLASLKQEEPGTYLAYQRDRQLQRIVARLESILDPDPADPWPRHLEHFGASLACSPGIYARAGGLPPVKPLEDVAFVDALRKAGAGIRHCPDTHVFTSARMDGRVQVGLSGQLKLWQIQSEGNETHAVDSAVWIEHRFRSMAALRRLSGSATLTSLQAYPEPWRSRIATLHAERLTPARFLELVNCNALIEALFTGSRQSEITRTISELTITLAGLESS